jgi:outer membrane protein assembly factor BamB
MSGIYPPRGYSFGIVNTSSGVLMKVLPLNVTAGEMAYDQTSGDVYVAGDTMVAVYDPIAQGFEKVIGIGLPIQGILYDAGTGELFITSGNSVYAFDPQTGARLGSAVVGNLSQGMAVDTVSGTLFVSSYLSCSIDALKSSDLEQIADISLPSPCYPSEMVLDPEAGALYVASGTNTVDVVGVASDSFERSISVGGTSINETFGLALDQHSGNVFVLTDPGTTISQVDVSTGGVVARFQLSSAANCIAVDQSDDQVYATVYHEVMVFNPTYSESGSTLPQAIVYATAVVVVIAVGLAYAFRGRIIRKEEGERTSSRPS